MQKVVLIGQCTLQAEEKDRLEKQMKELVAEQAIARMHHTEAESLAEKVLIYLPFAQKHMRTDHVIMLIDKARTALGTEPLYKILILLYRHATIYCRGELRHTTEYLRFCAIMLIFSMSDQQKVMLVLCRTRRRQKCWSGGQQRFKRGRPPSGRPCGRLKSSSAEHRPQPRNAHR